MRKIILLLAALVAALVLTGPIAVMGQESVPSVSVILSSEGLSAPETLPKGLVTIQFENTSEAPFVGVLLRLNDGVTLDDFFAAIAEDPLGMLPLVSLRGGPGLMPGQAGSVTYALDAGAYVLANFAGEELQMAMVTVADGEDTTQMQPDADLNVVMVDFGYGLPLTVPAGERIWRIENAGQQWHELAILPVEPGTTLEDVGAMLAAGEEAGPQALPVLMPMDAGQTVWVSTNLAPGTYAIVCFLPDLLNMDEMHIHAELGMIQLITVADTLAYTDPAGFFTVNYPAALTTVRPDLAREFGLPFPSVAFADSDETLDLSTAAQLVPEGGWGIAAMFIPEAFFTAMGMPEDAPLIDRATVFSPQEGNAEGLEVAAINEITLANGAPAIQAEGAGETEDTYVLFTQAGEGLYVMVSMISAPSGRTAQMVDGLMTVVNSIEFTGTAEDILAGMSGT